jgi:hypothetical protein
MEQRVAIHLAGYAVISNVLRVPVHKVFLCGNSTGAIEHPRHDDGPAAVYLNTEIAWRQREARDQIAGDPPKPRNQVFFCHILISLAGAAAERQFCDDVARWNIQADNKLVSWLIKIHYPVEREEMERRAEHLVKEHGDKILFS